MSRDEMSKEECLRIIEQKRKEMGISATKPSPRRKTIPGLPQHIFLRIGGKLTREEAAWTCVTCGEIEPKEYPNGFVPVKCPCQIEQARLLDKRDRREYRDRQEQLYAQRRLETCHSWLGDDWDSRGLMERTFENWNLAYQEEGYMAAIAYASNCRGNLILWSDQSYGTGKTHLAAAICHSLIYEGKSCLFTTATNLFNAFYARMGEHRGYSDLLKRASDSTLLVIDDLEKVGVSDYKKCIFFEVIDKRNVRGKATLITTNCRVEVLPDDVAGISDYIGKAAASRLCDRGNGGLMVIEMNGRDYRRIERQHDQI
jgi:DNA replication protein DnaC